MKNKVVVKKQGFHHWIDMENTVLTELKGDVSKACIEKAIAIYPNVSLKSIELKEAEGSWVKHFHVRLEEKVCGVPVNINVWLPIKWNGRFLGCVGGGSCACMTFREEENWSRTMFAPFALMNGFASANTDGGIPMDDNAWALNKETGAMEYERILNLAYRSAHSMTVIAKTVVKAVYGQAPLYSYLQGESGGGRQALAEAQLYPEDYDGIWASDPAINWTEVFTSYLWPLAVMNEEKHVLTSAKLEFFAKARIEELGGEFGFIETVKKHDFDPYNYVGKETEDGAISEEDVKVLKLITEGPKKANGECVWYGFQPETKFWNGLGFGLKKVDGEEIPYIGEFGNSYVGAWLKRDKDYDWKDLTYDEFFKVYDQGLRDFQCMQCNNPDLTGFKKHGSKLLLTHAVADGAIVSDGTLYYYENVLKYMGGEENVSDTLRLFMMPGGDHGAVGSPGLSLILSEGMAKLTQWVEEGIAPQELEGIQYDYATSTLQLEGKMPCYKIGGENKAFDIRKL